MSGIYGNTNNYAQRLSTTSSLEAVDGDRQDAAQDNRMQAGNNAAPPRRRGSFFGFNPMNLFAGVGSRRAQTTPNQAQANQGAPRDLTISKRLYMQDVKPVVLDVQNTEADVVTGTSALRAIFGADFDRLPNGVADLVEKSPTFAIQLNELALSGWRVEIGGANNPGIDIGINEGVKRIVFPNNWRGTPENFVRDLAFYAGKAQSAGTANIDFTSREAHLATNLRRDAEGILNNLVIRREIMDDGGADIGVSGDSEKMYITRFDQHLADNERTGLDRERMLPVLEAWCKGTERFNIPGQRGDVSYTDYMSAQYDAFENQV